MMKSADERSKQEAPAPPKSPRQTRMGPAPFASFEDVSDEVRAKQESPEDKPVIRLPDISEDAAVGSPSHRLLQQTAAVMENAGQAGVTIASLNLQTPSTPRIDISRASSSSHHDSRDSSPDAALFGIEKDKEDAKLGLGFREDGAADLRSSTEELAFLEPNTATTEKESSKQPSRRSPLMFNKEDPHRKDSQCSDIVLLSISGRTSRLSSIGSQGSAHSNASNMSHISGHSNVSHISGQSRLSVISGISRSPSPHKMILETSFCGPKPLENDVGVVVTDKQHHDVLEQVLLSRKHDPREAIIAEGVSVGKSEKEQPPAKEPPPVTPVTKVERPLPTKTNHPPKTTERKKSIEIAQKEKKTSPTITVSAAVATSSKHENVKKMQPNIPAKIEIVSRNRPNRPITQPKVKEEKYVTPSGTEYIRIRLKPENMYNDEEEAAQPVPVQESMQKPVSLNLNDTPKKNAQHFSEIVKNDDTPRRRKQSEESGDIKRISISSKGQTHSPCLTPIKHKDKDHGSRTPSPTPATASRKSSFCSLFKSKETIVSPDSPTGSVSKRKGFSNLLKDSGGHSSRSRSKSRDRDKDRSGPVTPTSTNNKSKGSMLAIFKPRKSSSSASPVARESLPNLDSSHGMEYRYSSEAKSVQNLRSSSAKERLRYYDAPVDGFIRIPLHTPSDEEEKMLARESSKITAAVKSMQEDLNQIRLDRPVSAPSSTRPSISHPTNIITDSKSSSKNTTTTGKEIILPDGSIRIPLHSPSEDRLVRVDLMTDQEKEEIYKQCSKITTKKNGSLVRTPNESITSSTDASKNEEKSTSARVETPQKAIVDVEISSIPKKIEPEIAVVSSTAVDAEIQPHEDKRSSQNKKHIIFATKVGSKEEQLFSLQFSLSKTDSQCSQMSESKSQISEESVIEVHPGDRISEDTMKESSSMDSKYDITPRTTDSDQPIQFVGDEVCTHSSEVVEMKTTPISMVFSERSFLKESSRSLKKQSSVGESISPKSSVDDPAHDSSESERDSELEFIRRKQLLALEKAGLPQPEKVDMERKNLVLQQESFDDELPYIPTTLPQERSVALPIIPIKQRQTLDIKTFPIERPRSTTPINPSCLEEYCSDEVYTPDTVKSEKLKICLPKVDDPNPKQKNKAKSPRRISTGSNPKSWSEFAEQGISNSGTRKSSSGHDTDSEPAPPLPPRAPTSSKPQWINFEEIPERRKLPKRIQTIPSRTNIESPGEGKVVYTYVDPEDCKCECHETGRDTGCEGEGEGETPEQEEDEEPLLGDSGEAEGMSAPITSRLRVKDGKVTRRSLVSDSSLDFSHTDAPDVIPQIGKPFNNDLDIGSNRSSVISQEGNRSSSSDSPNEVHHHHHHHQHPPRRSPRPK